MTNKFHKHAWIQGYVSDEIYRRRGHLVAFLSLSSAYNINQPTNDLILGGLKVIDFIILNFIF